MGPDTLTTTRENQTFSSVTPPWEMVRAPIYESGACSFRVAGVRSVLGAVLRAALTERDGPTALWDHQEGSLSHSKVKPEGGALCVGKARHGKAIRVFHILATVESHQGNAGTAGRSSPGIHPTSAFCAGSV